MQTAYYEDARLAVAVGRINDELAVFMQEAEKAVVGQIDALYASKGKPSLGLMKEIVGSVIGEVKSGGQNPIHVRDDASRALASTVIDYAVICEKLSRIKDRLSSGDLPEETREELLDALSVLPRRAQLGASLAPVYADIRAGVARTYQVPFEDVSCEPEQPRRRADLLFKEAALSPRKLSATIDYLHGFSLSEGARRDLDCASAAIYGFAAAMALDDLGTNGGRADRDEAAVRRRVGRIGENGYAAWEKAKKGA